MLNITVGKGVICTASTVAEKGVKLMFPWQRFVCLKGLSLNIPFTPDKIYVKKKGKKKKLLINR